MRSEIFSASSIKTRSVNEKVQREAMVNYYKSMNKSRARKERIELCKKFTRVYYPSVCLAFVVIFWITGILKYNE